MTRIIYGFHDGPHIVRIEDDAEPQTVQHVYTEQHIDALPPPRRVWGFGRGCAGWWDCEFN